MQFFGILVALTTAAVTCKGPLIEILQEIREQSPEDFETIMKPQVKHVSAYVATDDGKLIVQEMKAGKQLQALGGYTDAHPLPAMMNALRLEMQDEGNVVMTTSIMKGASRPYIRNNALIQAFYAKASEIKDPAPFPAVCPVPTKENELFSFEAHRAGLYGCNVHTVDLSTAETTPTGKMWRNCDRNSLLHLKAKGAFTEMKTSGQKPFETNNPDMRKLVDTVNKYPSLLNLMQSPWVPLTLEEQEKCLYNSTSIPQKRTMTSNAPRIPLTLAEQETQPNDSKSVPQKRTTTSSTSNISTSVGALITLIGICLL